MNDEILYWLALYFAAEDSVSGGSVIDISKTGENVDTTLDKVILRERCIDEISRILQRI